MNPKIFKIFLQGFALLLILFFAVKGIDTNAAGCTFNYSTNQWTCSSNTTPLTQSKDTPSNKIPSQEASVSQGQDKPNSERECCNTATGQSLVNHTGEEVPNKNMWGQKDVAQPREVDPRPTYTEDKSCYHPTGNPTGKITNPCAEDLEHNMAVSRVTPVNWEHFEASRGVTNDNDYHNLLETAKHMDQFGAQAGSNQTIAREDCQTEPYVPYTETEHIDSIGLGFAGYMPTTSSATVRVGPHKLERETNGDLITGQDVLVEGAGQTCTYNDASSPSTNAAQSHPDQSGQAQPSGACPGGNCGNGSGGNQGGGGQPQIPQIPQIPSGGGGQQQPQSGNQGTGSTNPTDAPNQDIGYQQMSDGAICPGNYDPVCGSDGVTYHNECIATHSNAVAATPTPTAVSSIFAIVTPEATATATASTFSIAFKGTCDGSSSSSNTNSELYNKLTQVIQQLFSGSGLGDLSSLGSLSSLGNLGSLTSALGSSSLPQNLINSVVQMISSLVSQFFQ